VVGSSTSARTFAGAVAEADRRTDVRAPTAWLGTVGAGSDHQQPMSAIVHIHRCPSPSCLQRVCPDQQPLAAIDGARAWFTHTYSPTTFWHYVRRAIELHPVTAVAFH